MISSLDLTIRSLYFERFQRKNYVLFFSNKLIEPRIFAIILLSKRHYKVNNGQKFKLSRRNVGRLPFYLEVVG